MFAPSCGRTAVRKTLMEPRSRSSASARRTPPPHAWTAAWNTRFQSEAGTKSGSRTGRSCGETAIAEDIFKPDFSIRRSVGIPAAQASACAMGAVQVPWMLMWLGIDVGTGGSRALLVDELGGVRAGYTSAHEDMHMERPLWAEQRPENWWDAVVDAVRGVLAKAGVNGAGIKGIGLSGQ